MAQNDAKLKADEYIRVYGIDEAIKLVDSTIKHCQTISWHKAKSFWQSVKSELEKQKDAI